jgi:hypothetical protein
MQKVLPEMGLRLGIGDKNTLLSRMSFKLYDQLNDLGIYPEQSVISKEDWLSILRFYASNASVDTAQKRKANSALKGSGHFKKYIFYQDAGQLAQTSMVRFMPAKKEIWLGSGSRQLEIFNLEGIAKENFRSQSSIVDAGENDRIEFLGIGNIMPNEDRNGRLYQWNEKEKGLRLLIDSLHRPVQMVIADIDKDGISDRVILEFGYETGQVRIVDGKSGGTRILSKQPGARNILLRDMDNDGLPELFILFAQSREQVSLFHNLGNHQFREEIVLHFPPVYGSSYMDLADMNGDGFEDLVLSFGDNADYSITPKSFHGIGIYLNDGKDKYAKKWFYPFYGATKTITGDFDNDGDQDMAMIAFFSEPGEGGSFLYFENKLNMQFTVHNLDVPDEKWLVMESGDMDEDGDLDLILGNFQNAESTNSTAAARNIKALVLINEQSK